jgi:hypothetical protein
LVELKADFEIFRIGLAQEIQSKRVPAR